MIEGFISFLCGDSKMAAFLRRHIIFKIVPMLNPDGVVLGNFRTGLSGKDFNR
jgi:murein tripeptide amidase MpaA